MIAASNSTWRRARHVWISARAHLDAVELLIESAHPLHRPGLEPMRQRALRQIEEAEALMGTQEAGQ